MPPKLKPASFTLNHQASTDGCSLCGETSLPPAFMVEHFGKRGPSDPNRSSGRWTFVGEAGEVFTVYEWRSTSQSNGRDSGSPTVREFWAGWHPVKLHIGGRPDTDWKTFRRWLRARYWAFVRAYVKAAITPDASRSGVKSRKKATATRKSPNSTKPPRRSSPGPTAARG